MLKITIPAGEGGRRFDRFLSKYLNRAPLPLIRKLLRKKMIKLNKKNATGSETVSEGDEALFYISGEFMERLREPAVQKDFSGTCDNSFAKLIIYEDENALVLNKPAGLLSHASVESGPSLIDMAVNYLKPAYMSFTPALCNRLDRNTSGLVVCGKNLRAVQLIDAAFAESRVKRFYIAAVSGEITEPGVIESEYRKDASRNVAHISRGLMKGKDTKKAATAYTPLGQSANRDFTLVRAELMTGLSHQIRAHFKYISHPIAGDAKYGDPIVNRMLRDGFGIRSQLLHAHTLHIDCDILRNTEWTAPPPAIFSKFIANAFDIEI